MQGGKVLAPAACSAGSGLVMADYEPDNSDQLWWVGTSPGGGHIADGVLVNVGCQQEAMFYNDAGRRQLALYQSMYAPAPGADQCKDHEAPSNDIQINADSSLSNPVTDPSMYAMIDSGSLTVTGSDAGATKWDAHVCAAGS